MSEGQRGSNVIITAKFQSTNSKNSKNPKMQTFQSPQTIADAIADACARIPPLWPLQSFVAVNPFVGLSDRTFTDACALMNRVTRGGMLMPAAYYREQGAHGVTDADLQNAIYQTGARYSLRDLRDWLQTDEPLGSPIMPTVAQLFDAQCGTHWKPFLVDEVSKWCSAYYDEGQASWRMPWRDLSLFDAWKQASWDDANPEMMGLRGFRELVRELPDSVETTIRLFLDELGVAPAVAADFLHRQLMSIGGWSAYTRYLARESEMCGQIDDRLQHLLAIRLAYDVAMLRHATPNFRVFWKAQLAEAASSHVASENGEITPAYLWLLAAETAHQRRLIAQLGAANAIDAGAVAALGERADVQAAFCIDVRSEVLRRHLETALPAIQTIGFAGFFGFAIEYVPLGAQTGNAQCPVLLLPKHRIEAAPTDVTDAQNQQIRENIHFSQRLGRAWNSFKTSAISCFAFVETGGVLAGGKLVKDSCAWHYKGKQLATQPSIALAGENGMGLQDQIATAAGALRGMGLTRDFARIILLCGHGSQSANNPYAAGLDCGACGGHAGDANARVAAAVLNDAQVRAGLVEQQIIIPDDCWFVAGLHNTTTDEVTLFDGENAPASHADELNKLAAALASAGRNARAERAVSLGLGDVAAANLHEKIKMRSHDWSQTRPEWGLAGNAAFIAAPRARTAKLDLNGRAFLHNYDASDDPQGAILTAIMTAPMVVASWINLQYYASTANNKQWGSGNKTIHNVVGTLGVWEGNAGDLQVGLPLQSVHDGEKFTHQPLRLSVFLEAPRAMIDAVIGAQTGVRELCDNGWIHVFAMEDEGREFWRYEGAAGWENVTECGEAYL